MDSRLKDEKHSGAYLIRFKEIIQLRLWDVNHKKERSQNYGANFRKPVSIKEAITIIERRGRVRL